MEAHKSKSGEFLYVESSINWMNVLPIKGSAIYNFGLTSEDFASISEEEW